MDVGHIVRRLQAVGADAEMASTGLLLEGKTARISILGRRAPLPFDLKRIADASLDWRGRSAYRPVIYASRASAVTIAWLQSHPNMTLVLEDQVVFNGIVHRLGSTPPVPPPRRKGPRPFARLATARVLLSGASREDQVRLAELAGVTQGSVSNALRLLPEIEDPGVMFDELVRDYPGPGGQTSYWSGSNPVHEQVRQLAELGALISGGFAADRIALWRRAERVVGYLDAPIDLSEAGYTPADSDDYTIMVVVPADPTLRDTATAWNVDGVADPIIATYDLLRTATTGDGEEAAAQIRDFVAQRFNDAQDGSGPSNK